MIDFNLNFTKIPKLIFQKEHLKKSDCWKKSFNKNKDTIKNISDKFSVDESLLYL